MSITNISLIKLTRVCFIVGLLLLPSTAFSQQSTSAKVTIFGQEIGAPLSLAACPKVTKKIDGKKREVVAAEYEISEVCYVGNVGPTTSLAILIPDAKRPGYVSKGFSSEPVPVRAYIIDGVVQGIDFKTVYSDNKSKDELYSDLQVKFGDHTQAHPREWQNDNGAKFTRYEYDWNSKTYLVSLREKRVYGSFVNGEVKIYTPKAASFLADVELEIKKKADEERRKKNGGL